MINISAMHWKKKLIKCLFNEIFFKFERRNVISLKKKAPEAVTLYCRIHTLNVLLQQWINVLLFAWHTLLFFIFFIIFCYWNFVSVVQFIYLLFPGLWCAECSNKCNHFPVNINKSPCIIWFGNILWVLTLCVLL